MWRKFPNLKAKWHKVRSYETAYCGYFLHGAETYQYRGSPVYAACCNKCVKLMD